MTHRARLAGLALIVVGSAAAAEAQVWQAPRAPVDETSRMSDADKASFHRLQAADAQWKAGDVDAAVKTLDKVAGAGGSLAALAYLTAARIRTDFDNLPGVVRTYEAMLRALPDYRVSEQTCDVNSLFRNQYVCSGDPTIATRLQAARRLLQVRATLAPRIADTTLPALERAASAVRLAEAWMAKAQIDPGPYPENYKVYSAAAERLYERAIQLAPRSTPAGDAAWRLIKFSEAYEWEGSIDEMYKWTVKQYRPFVATYPTHPHAGDALFEIARVSWAYGGYPQAVGYLPPDGPSDNRAAHRAYQAKALDPWFDTQGFGGEVDTGPPDPAKARAAQATFQRIVDKYPTSGSAPMASYWVAVIYDYCLKDSAGAVPAYKSFLAAHGALEPYAAKAKRRLAALAK